MTESTDEYSAQYHLLPVIRGALAQPSGNEDDRYARVLLTPETQSAGIASDEGGHVILPAPVLEADDDEIREETRLALDRTRGNIRRISLGDGPILAVQRDISDPHKALAGKVALVTGAAGAIGTGICRALMQRGCRVLAADLDPKGLASLRALLVKEGLAGDALLKRVMDVTDPASVEAGFAAAVQAWGGVDIVVANAGIALVATLMDMDIEAFRRVERVNTEGTLLTLAEAGRLMRRQTTGGDIVLTSTKNVFAPGASFGAYSATKAAAHQLARIASIEFAPLDIRVNMVAPDAVFSDGDRKSGLWAEVGPSRMKARGLDEEGLEEYYRGRNLLKSKVTPEHVANAVIFFVTRQTPTTGATLPVDGGLPDATPR